MKYIIIFQKNQVKATNPAILMQKRKKKKKNTPYIDLQDSCSDMERNINR